MKPELSLIAALAANGMIGRDNGMPWHLPEDLKRFRALTMGHPIIMGRRTWDALGRPLPGRTSIVVSRQPGLVLDGAIAVSSLDEAIAAAAAAEGGDHAFVIGGAQLYALALPHVQRLLLTEIADSFDGDTVFPAFEHSQWIEIARQPAVSADGLRYAFVDYVRR
ncbi:MAG: dihydrofolate reductase [Methyloversatilis sp.]|jgi:dihydrofolate reductase|nr:dihydrofolate reductase [Methyloversatilis sp.]MBP6193101.1 dihydrofolate reductase [Methyloversatilis sp.]MBP9116607.1 dihydrofolate reductase [Methyloversatilis sp.]